MNERLHEAAPVSLTLVRTFRAPPERVFDALTNPAALSEWWGPEGCHCPAPEVDLSVGGAYRLDIAETDGTVYELSGRYLEIDPPRRLSFTWTWTRGGYAGIETRVTIDLVARDGGTELTLVQDGFTSEEMRGDHDGGWRSSLDCLGRLLEEGPEE